MSGGFLRNSGRRVAQVLFRQSHHKPFFISSPHPSRPYIRSHLNASRFKDSTPSSSHSSAAAFSSSPSTASRNGIVSWYLGMIESRPILTKSLTAGTIFTAADITSQIITLKSSDSIDLTRTLRMAGYGMLVSGPSLHFWFNFVSRILPKRDMLNTSKKILLGQAVYGPIITAVFFSVNAGLQGETGAEIIARLKRDLLPTLINGLVYWPMCDFITFKFIPVRLQPLMSNSFSFIWTIYITYMASLQKASAERIGEELKA